MSKTRVENEFRESTSKDGTFSSHIDEKTTSRLTRYCKTKNINKTKFVMECINKQLDILEKEILMNLSKEELIEMYLSK